MTYKKEKKDYIRQSINIRVSSIELDMIKHAQELDFYSSYSEFVRRAALKEAYKILLSKDPESIKSIPDAYKD